MRALYIRHTLQDTSCALTWRSTDRSLKGAHKIFEVLAPQALAELVRSGTDDVRISALQTVGNLSFQVANRAIFLADAELMEWVYRLARDQVPLRTEWLPYSQDTVNPQTPCAMLRRC